MSSRAAKPETVTPLMRLRVSVTLRSGIAPMSCAVTESMICSASCLISCARITLPRTPVTCTFSISTVRDSALAPSCVPDAGDACCAQAVPLNMAQIADAMAVLRIERCAAARRAGPQ